MKITNHHEIVKKLIGRINPVGETNTDDERFENLKDMCSLIESLVMDVNDMAFMNKDAHEFSVKRAAEFGTKFLKELQSS